MPQPTLEPLNLGSIARGQALKLFEEALAKVSANIADKETPATKRRQITLTFEFKPDTDRRRVDVTTSAGVKLAAVSNHASTAYMGKDTDGNVHVFEQDPRQDILFEQPKPEETNLLKFGETS